MILSSHCEPRKIARSGFDIVHAFLPTIAFYAALGKSLYGFQQPFVLTIPTTQFTPGTERLIRKFFPRRTDRVLANSPSVRDYAVDLGFAADRISIVPNGHDVTPYQRPFDRDALRADMGGVPGEPLAIFVGRMIDTKRVEDLVDAASLLDRQGRSLRYALIGDGDQSDHIRARVASAGLNNRFRFLGRRVDVPDLLRSADVFVFPSIVEGLPNSVIEAGLAELPIAACDVPGVRDTLRHDETALLCPPCDPTAFAAAITKLLDDAELSHRLGKTARMEMQKKFSLERSLESLYDAYDDCLKFA
ncbi:MAG: glycosyltransferase family 4 protein [Pirellulales bacterium]